MTALESLLTKLASDDETERLAKEYENEVETKHGRCDYGCCYSSSRIVDAFDAGYTAAHARMSLLVEICRIQNAALEYYRGDKVNQGFKMVDLAGDTLAKLEAMAKEQT